MVQTDRIRLERFQPDNDVQVQELTRQRILCGWGSEHVEVWRTQVRTGDKNLYWIHPLTSTSFPVPDIEYYNLEPTIQGPPPPDLSFQPLGHVSLDWEDYGGDDSLTSREEGTVTIATFFVLHSQQNRGLGREAMDALELLAVTLSARTITLNAVPQEKHSSPPLSSFPPNALPNFREAFWYSLGLEYDPQALVSQRWYTRRGYVAYKTAPRYQKKNRQGEIVTLPAVFMRKKLGTKED